MAKSHSSPDAFTRASLSSSALQIRSLADETVDHAMHLEVTGKAFTAVEKLVSSAYLTEQEDEVLPSRSELGALLYLINVDLKRQTHGIIDAATALSALATANANANANAKPSLDSGA